MQGLDDQARDGGLAQVTGAGTGLVEQPVHGHEGLSGSQAFRREDAMGGQAPVETASHEQRLAEGLPMWQATLVEGHTG